MTEIAAAPLAAPQKTSDTFIHKFCQHKMAVAALIIFVIEALSMFLLPVVLELDPYTITDAGFNARPSIEHLLGTDEVGRDVFARLLYGGQVSLFVGFASTLLSLCIGLPLGLLAGYYRGWLEALVMRAADICLAVPSMILAIVIVAIFGPSLANVTFVIGFLGWTVIAKLLYGNVLSVRKKEYVEAAKAIGTRDIVIIFKYVLPNAIAPIWITTAFRISTAIIMESALSFLGAGVQPPQASWGNIIYAAQSLVVLTTRPWLWIPPGICLIVTIVCINLVGEGIRDALDPKMKR